MIASIKSCAGSDGVTNRHSDSRSGGGGLTAAAAPAAAGAGAAAISIPPAVTTAAAVASRPSRGRCYLLVAVACWMTLGRHSSLSKAVLGVACKAFSHPAAMLSWLALGTKSQSQKL